MRLLTLPFIAVMAAPLGLPAQAPPSTIKITEWTVPWEKSRPRDPVVDASGRVWFVGQATNYVATLDPKSGEFRQITIEDGTHPHNIIVDAQGNAWYAGNRNGRIGRIDAATGAITVIRMPDSAVRDPHTLIGDSKGNIWFTAQRSNYVGHLVTATREVHVLKVPTPNALPYGIVVDRNDRPWFVEFGSNKLATIDPATMKITEYTLPNPSTRARRLEAHPDGSIWYADYTRGMVARFDPATQAVQEWPLPSGAKSMPYATAMDDRGRIWLAETGPRPNQLAVFDTKSQAWVSVTPITPSGALTIRHMYFDPRSKSVWFGTDANTVGRATLP